MDESDKLDAFIRGFNPRKGNKTKLKKIVSNGDFGAVLDAIKHQMSEKEAAAKSQDNWKKTNIHKHDD